MNAIEKPTYKDGFAYEWVTAKYTGEQAKKVADLAASNTGYIEIAKSMGGANMEIVVAFARPIDSPTPEHLMKVIDTSKINEFEKKRCLRKGVHGTNSDEQKRCGLCGLR